MKKIISIAVCFVILLSCVLPVQASGGVPEKVMDATKSVVRILSKYYNGSATGSGFVIKNEPGEVLIATNDHVVSGNPRSISVWVGENELVDAEIVFTTSAKDLCVLRVTDPIDMKPLTLSTEDPQHGAAIYVVGYPGAGDILSDTQAHTSESVTITDGIISAIRTFTIENGADPVKLLQVNAAINSGNSGGPLFNSEGVVIGVNTYKVNANSQGVFGSVDISELWGLLEQHGIEIPMQQEVVEEEIPEEKVIPVSIITIAVGTVVTLIVIFVLIKAKKKKAKTLRKFMEAHPNGLGVSEAASLLLPVAIQLRNLHNNGKLHLQVSPDSILISAASTTLKESSKKETDRLSSGFAAPEIYKGVGFGAASDIYSFAAVLYYTAVGKIPANSLQSELLDEEFSLLEENESTFTELIRKSMAFLPQDRTQSMQELIYGVSAFHNQEFYVPQSSTDSIQKVPTKKKQKTKLTVVPVAIVCVIAIIVVAILWKSPDQPEVITVSTEQETTLQETTEAITLESIAYAEAEKLVADGETARAAIAFGKLVGYKDARERSLALWQNLPRNTFVAAGGVALGLKENGTVVMAFNQNTTDAIDKETKAIREKQQQIISNWTDIVSLAFHYEEIRGLKCDGTIVSAADDRFTLPSVEWHDVVYLSDRAAITADGSVFYSYGSTIPGWTDIKIISEGNHTVGVKSDGTVLVHGSCVRHKEVSLSDWTDVVSVATYLCNIVGLKADGTVLVSGSMDARQLDAGNWTDIVAVSVGESHTVGLKRDGTVVAVGNTKEGQCNVSEWTDIEAIYARNNFTVGLKSDGTILYTGSKKHCPPESITTWEDIQIP